MTAASLPDNEWLRLKALRDLGILDSPVEAKYDCITQFLARGLNVPICLISLVDKDRQWFKSAQGLDLSETPRQHSICAYAILGTHSRNIDGRFFEVYDTYKDFRFNDNPLVYGGPKIRSYLGYVLQSDSQMNLGTLCVIDTKPRAFSYDEKYLLMIHGTMIETLMHGNALSTGPKFH